MNNINNVNSNRNLIRNLFPPDNKRKLEKKEDVQDPHKLQKKDEISTQTFPLEVRQTSSTLDDFFIILNEERSLIELQRQQNKSITQINQLNLSRENAKKQLIADSQEVQKKNDAMKFKLVELYKKIFIDLEKWFKEFDVNKLSDQDNHNMIMFFTIALRLKKFEYINKDKILIIDCTFFENNLNKLVCVSSQFKKVFSSPFPVQMLNQIKDVFETSTIFFNFPDKMTLHDLNLLEDHGFKYITKNLWECNHLCDFTVHVQNQSFPVRRSILEKSIPTLFKGLGKDIKELRLEHIEPMAAEAHFLNCYNINCWVSFEKFSKEQIASYFKFMVQFELDRHIDIKNYINIIVNDLKNDKLKELLLIFIDLIKEIESQSPLKTDLHNSCKKHLDILLSLSLKRYLNTPLKYPEYFELLKTHGKYLHNLEIKKLPIEIVEALTTYFPHLHQLVINSIKNNGIEAVDQLTEKLTELKSVEFSIKEVKENLLIGFRPSWEAFTLKMIYGSEDQSESSYTLPPFNVQLPNLRHLTLQSLNCTNEFLESLKNLPNLENLDLYDSRNIDFSKLKEILKSLKKINNLNLSSCGFLQNGIDECVKFSLTNDKFRELKKILPIAQIASDASSYEKWPDMTDFKQVLSVSVHPLSNCISITSHVKLDSILKSVENVHDTFESQANRSLNRYTDICQYDINSLKQELGFVINMSEIKGLDTKRRFAAQGPIKKTTGDFLSAIHALGVDLVVMTAKCMEEGKPKCEMYWPEELNTQVIHKDQLGSFIQIELLSEKDLSSKELICKLRKFKIVNLSKKTTQETCQLQVTNWSDNTPLSETGMLNLIKMINEIEHQNKGSTLFHCSAGVGRTGTTMMCLLLQQAINKQLSFTQDSAGKMHPEHLHLNLENAVIALRQQRDGMIGTSAQLDSVVRFFQNTLKDIMR